MRDGAPSVKIRARWLGPLPKAGDYLMSEVRPRFAYCLRSVTPTSPRVRWDMDAKAEVHQLVFEVDRIAAAGVPKHARVHSWKWDKRGKSTKGKR
jgi:hypothetical protein